MTAALKFMNWSLAQAPTLPCRHIHHINTLKDGWIIGTGEIYPNGWLLYVQQKMADTYSVVDAREELIIRRINTEEGSVQRTMGLMLSDSPDNDIVFASDHDTLARNEIDAQKPWRCVSKFHRHFYWKAKKYRR